MYYIVTALLWLFKWYPNFVIESDLYYLNHPRCMRSRLCPAYSNCLTGFRVIDNIFVIQFVNPTILNYHTNSISKNSHAQDRLRRSHTSIGQLIFRDIHYDLINWRGFESMDRIENVRLWKMHESEVDSHIRRNSSITELESLVSKNNGGYELPMWRMRWWPARLTLQHLSQYLKEKMNEIWIWNCISEFLEHVLYIIVWL